MDSNATMAVKEPNSPNVFGVYSLVNIGLTAIGTAAASAVPVITVKIFFIKLLLIISVLVV